MHFYAITKAEYCPKERMPNYIGFAEECAKLTKKIAIEFCRYCFENQEELMHLDSYSKRFNQFLKHMNEKSVSKKYRGSR